MNHTLYWSVNKMVPNMYPKDVPALVAENSNQICLDNIYDDLKKVRPDLADGNKRGDKPG